MAFSTTPVSCILQPMSTLLNAKQLQRSFHGRLVVEPLDLQLSTGDILGLLGPNGAGKSTIMRMLCGDLAPSGGTVEIGGDDLLQQPLPCKRRIGFLPERPPLHHDQTVDEYLTDCAYLRGMDRSACKTARLQSKQQCGLESVGSRLIRKLSKGYQQRVGLAQAIIHDPQVVILDEPTDGLDPAQIRQVRELIRSLAETRGVILSSHILPEIQATCNRVVILQDGRTVYSGDLSPPASPCYRIGLEQDPDEVLIAALSPVTSVERLHTDYFRVTLKTGANPSELSRLILEKGWGLIELTPETLSLEQRYLQATTGGES
ncbi:MAG: ABC transporter ATP-binding protein [Candidatus Thiodiazotropha sp. (ex Semelilucina semeliformis)]|nr:ABC transporter ATP-binding protein [Candidatus Thiodiazotropha sp. (ex Semelilucina semeliformis)]